MNPNIDARSINNSNPRLNYEKQGRYIQLQKKQDPITSNYVMNIL